MDDTHRPRKAKAQADGGPHPRPRRLWKTDLAGSKPGDGVELDPDEARHALRVLRMREGDAVELIDGRGTVAEGKLTRADARRAMVEVVSRHEVAEPRPRVAVFAAPPKGARLEAMAGTLVQLGVDRLVLLETRRSVAEPGTGKRRRLERVVVEACKQCGRAWSMSIEGPIAFDAAIAEPAAGAGVRLLAHMQGPPLHDLPARVAHASEVSVLVGPDRARSSAAEHSADNGEVVGSNPTGPISSRPAGSPRRGRFSGPPACANHTRFAYPATRRGMRR